MTMIYILQAEVKWEVVYMITRSERERERDWVRTNCLSNGSN